MLRKLLYSTALFLGVSTIALGQAERAAIAQPSNNVQAISNNQDFSHARKGNPANQVNTLFDVQFNYNLSAARGAGGNAAVTWTGTEFWVSAWGSDSLFTLDVTGVVTSRFVVPGLTGVRALTWDGFAIFAGANTASIYEISPVSKTIVGTTVAPIPVRGLAYDSLADAGAGGFWVSNYDTDISLISRAGVLLNIIPAVAHGLTAMYGIAVDNYSIGGPFIWAFDQASSAGQSDLRRINITSGITDMLIHDVMSDVGAGGTSGLAGGLCITWGIDSAGARSIVGVLQGTPSDRLFGYELNDYVAPDYDVVADGLNFSPAVTLMPLHLASPIYWDMDITNAGAMTIDTLNFTLSIDSSGTNIFSNTSTVYSVASGLTSNIPTAAGFTPTSLGNYDVSGILDLAGQTATNRSDDTIRYELAITDSTMGLDDGNITGSLGIGTPGGVLGQKFTISSGSYASSVSFFCSAPTAGDTVSADLYTFAGTPGSVIASTYQYIFTAGDAANGVFLDLGFTSAPYQIAAGTYFVGIKEYSQNVSLAYTGFNFQNNTGFALVPPSATWSAVESVSFFTTFILRLNVLDPLFVGVPQVYKQDVFTMYPNPAANMLTVKTKGANASSTLSLFDMTGREVYSSIGVEMENTIDLHSFSEGIYFVRLVQDGKVYSEKVTIAK